jgi:hypothetical protein
MGILIAFNVLQNGNRAETFDTNQKGKETQEDL